MTGTPRDEPGSPGHDAVKIALAGAASLALYGAVDRTEHALALNGLVAGPGLIDPGFPADRAAAATQFALYAVANVALFALYVWVLVRSRRGAFEAGWSRIAALSIPVVFHVALALRTPRLSQDLFSYMGQGYLGIVPGSNPLLRPASDAAMTAIGPGLGAYGWGGVVGVTPYGILWTRMEMAIMHATSDVPTALLLFKTVVLLLSMATAAAIWSFVGKAAPRWQVTSTLAYLWNPLFVVELAGEGHNDVLMVAAVMVGLAALVAHRTALGGIALFLGVFTKYVPLLFVPPQLVWAYRTRRSTGALLSSVGLAVLGGLVIAAVLYAPLWAGTASFTGILHRADPISSASPFGALNWVLRRSPLRAHAGQLSLLFVILPVIAFVFWRSAKVKDAPGLARVCGTVALLFLLGAAPDYWPWYSILPAVLFIASADPEALFLAVVLAVCARLIAPFNALFVNGVIGMKLGKGLMTGVGATVPLLVAGVLALRSRLRSST